MKFFYTFLLTTILHSAATMAQVTVIAPKRSVRVSDTSVVVDLRIKSTDSISSLQFTLGWNPAVIAFKSVDSMSLPAGAGIENFGTTNTANGRLQFVWITPRDGYLPPDSSRIFRAVFRVVGKLGDSSAIQFLDTPIRLKATNAAGTTIGTQSREGWVKVSLTNAVTKWLDTEGVTLGQNAPNPVLHQTVIPFEITESDNVLFKIHNLEGRILYQSAQYYTAGKHEIRVNTEGLLSKGIYVYSIQTHGRTISKKMVVD